MNYPPILSNAERGERQKRMVQAYNTGLCSRTVAQQFGMSSSYVKRVVQLYGASRPVGRPRR